MKILQNKFSKTESKKRAALKKSDGFSNGLLDSLSSHIVVINASGSIIKVNKAWNTFLFNNGATVLDNYGEGGNYFDVCKNRNNVEDEIAAKRLDGIKKVFDGTLSEFYLEYPCHSSEKEEWFSMRVVKFEIAQKLVLIEHHSITERKLAEDNLIVASDKLQGALEDIKKIMDSSLDVICAVHEDGHFMQVSAACETVWGYKADELIGKPMIDFVYSPDREKTQTTATSVIAGNNMTNFENRYVRKDGSLVPMHWSARWNAQDRVRYGVARDATEKKRSEEILEIERQRFNDLFLKAPTCIGVLKGPAHIFEMANPLYLQLIGKENIIGKSVKDVLPEIANQGFIELLDEVYKTGKTFSANEMLIKLKGRSNGELYDSYLNFIYQAYNNDEGDREGVLFFAIDVTEQVVSRKKIEESEKHYSELIQSLPVAAYSCDPRGRILIYNKAAVALWGREPEVEADRWCGSLNIYSTDGNLLLHNLSPMAKASKEGRVVTGEEIIIQRPNGDKRNVVPHTVPIISSSGLLTGTVNVMTDVTEKRMTEAVLFRSDSQLILAAQMARLGYWEFDIINDLFTFTDQFYAIFKTTAEKMGGYTMPPDRYAELFVYPDDRAIVGREVGSAINSPDPDFSRKIEHRIIYADGETGWISVHFCIVKDDEGRTIKTFGVNQDITERKKAEETLRRSEMNLGIKNTQLEQKNTELEQFAFIASHDLQEPLRTTSSFVKLLQKQYKENLDPKADKYFTYILEASERMRELIKNLLDHSRIGNKKELEQVDCNKILHDVLADLGVAITEAAATIRYEPLPVVDGYAAELKQLFQNLVTNAIKFSKKEIPPEIDISVQMKDDYWQFAFKDNGIGIEEKDNKKIFAIFQRLHTRTEYEGSGIGLSHCKKIIELHKGKIWVDSEIGAGSTFRFTIQSNNFLN